jgi:hypothetical protein
MSDTPTNPYPDEKDTTDYQISRGHAWRIALYFFPLIALLPLSHHLIQAFRGKGAETPAAKLLSWRPSAGPLLTRLHEVEKSTDKAGYATFIRQTTQSLLTYLAGEGNRKVYVGSGDWLYYQPELTALHGWGPLKREPFSPMKDPSMAKLRMAKDVVLEYAAQLKERGVPLLLVPVPVKAMIYPEYLAIGRFKEPLYHPDQKALYDQFRAAGIDVMDLSEEMWKLKYRMQIFLQQDTHWTPDVMKLMAEHLNKHIRAKYPQAVKEPLESPLVNPRIIDRASYGDLVGLLDVTAPQFIFGKEEATLVSIQGMDPSAKSPIALLGDSFVNVFDDPALGFTPEDGTAKDERIKAGLANQLAVLLNQPIDVFAVNGGGATPARRDFARRFDDEVRAKKLVVWVIACRDLLLSPSAARDANVTWERVEFNPKTSDGSAPAVATPTPDTKIVIEAKLVEKSKLQDAGGTPYTHALHTANYELQKVVSGTFASTDWLALQWTFKNKENQPTASASIGKTYRLTLVPESAAPPEAKSVNTSDDFTDRFTAERFFVEQIEEVK